MPFETEVVACICHSPLHHQKPDFEGQSVIKASSYLLPFVLEAHRESLPRSCETSARRLSAESAEVYSTADLPASAAHIPFSGYEPRRLHSELRTSRCVFELHHRQDSKLPRASTSTLRAADITVCVRTTSSSGLQTASSVLQQLFNGS